MPFQFIKGKVTMYVKLPRTHQGGLNQKKISELRIYSIFPIQVVDIESVPHFGYAVSIYLGKGNNACKTAEDPSGWPQ